MIVPTAVTRTSKMLAMTTVTTARKIWSLFSGERRKPVMTSSFSAIERPIDLREAVRQLVESCVADASRASCDCEDLWCHHWRNAIIDRIFNFVVERERLRDERAVKLAEDATLDYRFNAHYQGGFSMAQVRIIAAICDDRATDGERREKEKT